MALSPLLLRRWELFAHVSDPQLERLAEHVDRLRFEAGAAVLREGEPSLGAYLIESGEVLIERNTPYGRFELARLGPGELFGETSFVDGQARSGNATATAETALLTLQQDALAAALDEDPKLKLSLYWTFWKSLSQKLRATNDKLTRFFSSAAAPTAVPAETAAAAAGEFRVDLASKRRLFQEQKLSNLEINFLTTLSKEKKLAANQVLFREGETGDSMYVVLEGRIMISKYIPGAGEEALAFLERGDYFGEMALIDHQPRSADAKAHEQEAVVLAISREVLEGLLDIQKISSLNLLKILCNLVASRLREIDDKIIGWFILAGGSNAGP